RSSSPAGSWIAMARVSSSERSTCGWWGLIGRERTSQGSLVSISSNRVSAVGPRSCPSWNASLSCREVERALQLFQDADHAQSTEAVRARAGASTGAVNEVLALDSQ